MMMRAEMSVSLSLVPDSSRFGTEIAGESRITGQRMEDWIVSTLGEQDASCPRDDWEDVIGRIAPKRRTKNAQSSAKGPAKWGRFRLAKRRGITVVELTDKSLIKENELTELAGDLLALVGAGHHRIVLNFVQVERLSSWAVSFISESIRRCAMVNEGTLKVCGLRPDLAAIFTVTGQAKRIPIFPDETTAVDDPWPYRPEFVPLPVDILAALTRAADAPLAELEPEIVDDSDPRDVLPIEEAPVMYGVWLIPRVGVSTGRAIPVEADRFVIGRDPSCNVRPDVAAVSRLHAAIERRDHRVFLIDLGSVNGTLLNGQLLRNEEIEVQNGDLIALGPVNFRIAIGTNAAVSSAIEDLVVAWVKDQDVDGIPLEPERPTEEFSLQTTSGGPVTFKNDLIQDVLIVTPMTADLDAELTINLLRTELQSLYDRTTTRRVVVNLTHVGHLSGRAIGILLAHHLELDRAGGALRVCQAHARVGAVLEQVHLGMLVECFPTLEDAVLQVWPRFDDTSSAI